VSPSLSWANTANVRNVQEVWPDLSMHIPDIRRPTSAPDDLWETDDSPSCICEWALNARHIETGIVKIWLRGPEKEGKNKSRMLWRCPVHNPYLAERQSTHTTRVAPLAIFCYRFDHYRYADTARRAAHRYHQKDLDGSYLLLSRMIGKSRVWDMASSLNLTPRKSSWDRARTVEADKETVIPFLHGGLCHLPTLRTVTPKHLWHPGDEDEEASDFNEHEVRYEIIPSGTGRTVANVSKKVLGRRVEHGDVVTRVEWADLQAYISRGKGTTTNPPDTIDFDIFGVEG